MEISEITIRDFKGIEKVTLSPLKPINVLIGRNNSGKSSVLACLQLLTKYFIAFKAGSTNTDNPTIRIKENYMRQSGNGGGSYDISVTVNQSEEERTDQFLRVVKNWNANHSTPKMDAEKALRQASKGLFRKLKLCFGANADGDAFGLTSIRIPSIDVEDSEDIVLCGGGMPGSELNALSLLHLFVQKGSNWPQPNCLLELVGEEGVNHNVNMSLRGGSLRAGEPRVGAVLLNPALQYVRRAFASAFLVSPYRHGNIVAPANRSHKLSENGDNLVNYLHDLTLNKHEVFQRVAAFVQAACPEVGRLHPRHVNDGGSELELAYEWLDGRVVNLANMGGGVEQLLVLAALLIEQRTSLFLWEEPESHLHPGAQDVLMSKLEEYVGDSMVFLTSHSPAFVRGNEKVAVHVITNSDGRSGVGRTLSAHELQKAAVMLGSRPGHLAQADIVVYVEGKWGAAAFEEWLKKWPSREDVLGHLLLVVQPCNPDEIGTKDYDLASLKKVTPNMVMLVDKDNDEGSDEPKKARKTLRQKCTKLRIPCVITEKRQIEWYFTDEAIKTAIPKKLITSCELDLEKSLGEQLPNGWKKYNPKIAASMQWEDVSEHKDVMKVFQEIETYAKSLRPEMKTD